jgi:tetratricopeptide (TPR) repeat protein
LLTAVLVTRAQGAYWRNDETLWRHTLAVTANNHHAHTSLGVIEAKRGNFAAAIEHFREAARLSPNYWRAYGNLAQMFLATGDTRGAMEAAERAIHLNPGEPGLQLLLAEARRAHAVPMHTQAQTLLGEGRYAEAVEVHERAMHFDPAPLPAVAFAQSLANAGQLSAAEGALREALNIDPNCDDATLELAYVREHLGALDEAAQLYRRVLNRKSDHVAALAGLAEVLTRTGQINDALPLVEKALAVHPNDGPSLYTLGTIRLLQGQAAEAVKVYRQALAARADMPEAQANLAWILATSTDDSLRNGAEAVRWARSACGGTSGQNPAMLRILAAAHAEAGQFSEALTVIERAIALAQSLGDTNLVTRLTMQRGLYQNHQPLRVPLR